MAPATAVVIGTGACTAPLVAAGPAAGAAPAGRTPPPGAASIDLRQLPLPGSLPLEGPVHHADRGPTEAAVLYPSPAAAARPHGLFHHRVLPGPAGSARGTTTAATGPRVQPEPTYYLALGASESVGVQPTAAYPRGAATDAGYANDVAAAERPTWPGLQLVRIGCPGETTGTMIAGHDHCSYPDGSQLATAVDFLRNHPSTVLVTVDIGFNDLNPCFHHHEVDGACIDTALDEVHDQLADILATLRAASAGDHGILVVGVGHNDPYLGAYLRGPRGQALAAASIGVLDRLDQTLRTTYGAAGVPVADVAGAFRSADVQRSVPGTSTTSPATGPTTSPLPVDVARTCALTWMCAPRPYGPNIHPNAAGYLTIAQVIEQTIARTSAGD